MATHFIVAEELLKNVIEKLQSDLKVLLKWFGKNGMMTNPWKFQYALLGKHKALKIEIERLKLESAKAVKLPIFARWLVQKS